MVRCAAHSSSAADAIAVGSATGEGQLPPAVWNEKERRRSFTSNPAKIFTGREIKKEKDPPLLPHGDQVQKREDFVLLQHVLSYILKATDDDA